MLIVHAHELGAKQSFRINDPKVGMTAISDLDGQLTGWRVNGIKQKLLNIWAVMIEQWHI